MLLKGKLTDQIRFNKITIKEFYRLELIKVRDKQ